MEPGRQAQRFFHLVQPPRQLLLPLKMRTCGAPDFTRSYNEEICTIARGLYVCVHGVLCQVMFSDLCALIAISCIASVLSS